MSGASNNDGLAALLKHTMLATASPQINRLRYLARKLYDLRYSRDTRLAFDLLKAYSELEEIQAPAVHIMKQLPRGKLRDTITLDDLPSDSDHNPLVQTSNIEAPSDLYSEYKIARKDSASTYVLRRGNLIGQGVYNHIYECTFGAEHLDNKRTDAVIKTPVLPAVVIDLILEAIIHTVVSRMAQGREYFIHLLAVLRLPIDYWPGTELAVIMTRHPGRDFDDYMSQYKVNSIEVIAVLQQVAYGLLLAQRAIGFMHRDLKADNIMVLKREDTDPEADMPESERRLLERPETIVVDATLSFKTYGFSTQMCDFGASRIQPAGDSDAFAIPIIQIEDAFNACTDLAHLASTFATDFDDDMRKYAPEAREFLNNYCADVLRQKDAQDDRSFYDICQEITDPRFEPRNFIARLQEFQEHLVRSRPDLLMDLAPSPS